MKENLYEKIYNELFYKIKFGQIKEGEKLPTEFEIMKEYSVSRITAIRALNELKAKGFISRSRKTGSKVLPAKDIIQIKLKKTVAVVLSFSDKNYTDFLSGMRKAAYENEIFLSFFYSNQSAESERNILNELLLFNPDGIILEPCTRYGNIEILSRFIIKKTPLVFLDTHIEGLNNPCVTSDNRAGMYYIAECLIKKGHTKIAYYPMHFAFLSSEISRFTGYCEALVSKNLPINEKFLLWTDSVSHDITKKSVSEFDIKNARQAVNYIASLKEKPTAICCLNDVSANFIIEALKEKNLTVPQDFSVTGFDNTDLSKRLNLTTAYQDYETLGSYALEKLISLFKYLSDNKDIFVPVKILERNSVKDLNKL